MSSRLFTLHIIPKAANQTLTQADPISMPYAKPIIPNGITGSSQVKSSQYHAVQYMRYVSTLLTILNMMMMPMMMIQIERPCIQQLAAGKSQVSQYVEYVGDEDTTAG